MHGRKNAHDSKGCFTYLRKQQNKFDSFSSPIGIKTKKTGIPTIPVFSFTIVFCGERGIRTPDTLLAYMRFPGAPLKPLEHLSFYSIMIRSVITLSLTNNACLVSLMRWSSISKFPLSICLCACDMR